MVGLRIYDGVGATAKWWMGKVGVRLCLLTRGAGSLSVASRSLLWQHSTARTRWEGRVWGVTVIGDILANQGCVVLMCPGELWWVSPLLLESS